MAEVEVEVKLDQRALRRLGESLEQGLEIIGGVGELAAKQHAPVDTGTLRRSITHELGRRGLNQYVRIGTNIQYAIFQEIGTRLHPAHPYLRPAMETIGQFLKNGGKLS